MKTKFYWLPFLASAAMIAPANAGGHRGGGAFSASAGPGRGGVSTFHAAPMHSFGGHRAVYSGPRFSTAGVRPAIPGTFQRQAINANIGARELARENVYGVNRTSRWANGANHGMRNSWRAGNGAGQVHHGNHNLLGNWRHHVVAQHSPNWQRGWNRHHDHSWHGHRCRFINGNWFVFDVGYGPWWPTWYPYGYYDYDSYAYGGDADAYQGGYAEQSTVAGAQERLAEQGYYRGEIDGIFGPQTGRAVARFQTNHGLRVTGSLTTDTLQALGLRRVASN